MTRIFQTSLSRILAKVVPPLRSPAANRRIHRLSGVVIPSSSNIAADAQFLGVQPSVGCSVHVGEKFCAYGGTQSTLHIADNVAIGPNTVFLLGSHRLGTPDMRAGGGKSHSAVIGRGSWLGGRVTVVGSVKIGEGCVIGAGEVVRDDVPPNHLFLDGRATPIRD